MRVEIRAQPGEMRVATAEGAGPRFSGYAAKFDVWSQDLGGFRERIQRGAFAESLNRGDDVRCLVNHQADKVLGRIRSGTLKLSEDEVGLRFEVEAPDAQWARDLQRSVERGDVDQCSFAFALEDERSQEWILRDRGSGELDERIIKRAKLFDVSIVTFPAYEDTEVSARGIDQALEEAGRLRKERGARRRKSLRRRLELKTILMGGVDHE